MKERYSKIIFFIIIIAIVVKIIIIQKNSIIDLSIDLGLPNGYSEQTNLYDLNEYEKFDSNGELLSHAHLYYIMYLHNNHKVLYGDYSMNYHPPLYYIISANWLSIMDLTNLSSLQKIESLSYLNLIFFIISVLLILMILNKLKMSDFSKIIVLLVYCFYPKVNLALFYLTNDFLTFIFQLAILIQIMRWSEKDSISNTVVLALLLMFGCLTKFNCLMMIFPIFIVWLIKFYKEIKDKNDIGKLILEGIIICVLGCFGCLIHPLMDIIYSGDYRIVVPNSKLFCGNDEFWVRFGISFKEMITCDYFKNSIFNGLLFSALNFELTQNMNVLLGIGISNFILIFLSILGFFEFFKNKELFSKIVLSTYIFNMISYISYNIKMPYTCTMDSRYIFICLLCGFVFLGAKMDTKNRMIKIISLCTTLIFDLFSVINFII